MISFIIYNKYIRCKDYKSKVINFMREEEKIKYKAVTYLAAVFILFFLYHILIGSFGLWGFVSKYYDKKEALAKYIKLEKQLDDYARDIQLIKRQDKDIVEELVQKKLNRIPNNAYIIKE